MDIKSNFNQVGEFHQKFGLPVSNNKGDLPPTKALLFKLKHLNEEINEYVDGISSRDPEKIFDALIDLVYVALGAAHFCNFPWDEGFDEVHRANMQKERATHPSQSKRGSTLDVVKPVFWHAPDIKGILMKHNPEAHDA